MDFLKRAVKTVVKGAFEIAKTAVLGVVFGIMACVTIIVIGERGWTCNIHP